MSSTKYDQLAKEQGITKDICPYCNKNVIEVFQDNFEGCYQCWCEVCDPRIEYRD